MNSPLKMVVMVVLGLVAAYIALHIVFHIITSLLGFVLSIALPVLIVAGIGYGLYRVFSPRALGAGRTRFLP